MIAKLSAVLIATVSLVGLASPASAAAAKHTAGKRSHVYNAVIPLSRPAPNSDDPARLAAAVSATIKISTILSRIEIEFDRANGAVSAGDCAIVSFDVSGLIRTSELLGP